MPFVKRRREHQIEKAAEKAKTDETTRWHDWEEHLLPVLTKAVEAALDEYAKRVVRDVGGDVGGGGEGGVAPSCEREIGGGAEEEDEEAQLGLIYLSSLILQYTFAPYSYGPPDPTSPW